VSKQWLLDFLKGGEINVDVIKRVLRNIPNQRHAITIERYLFRELDTLNSTGIIDDCKDEKSETHAKVNTGNTDKIDEIAEESDDGGDETSEYEDLLADEEDDIAEEFERADEDEDEDVEIDAEDSKHSTRFDPIESTNKVVADYKSDAVFSSLPQISHADDADRDNNFIDLSDSDSEDDGEDLKPIRMPKQSAASPDSVQLSTSSPNFKGCDLKDSKYMIPTTVTAQMVSALRVNFQIPQKSIAPNSKPTIALQKVKNPRLVMKNDLRRAAVHLANSANAKRWEIKDKDLTVFLKAEIQVSKFIALLKFKERRAEQNAILREIYEKIERERKQEEILRRYEQFADDDDEGELDFNTVQKSSEASAENDIIPRRAIYEDVGDDDPPPNEYGSFEIAYDRENGIVGFQGTHVNNHKDDIDPMMNEKEMITEGLHDDETMHHLRVYGKKSRAILADEDCDKSDSGNRLESSEGVENDEDQLPTDPIELMKFERAKALERSKSYRQQILMEERLARGMKRSAYVEDEAEEDEDEGLQGGLDDYGFGSLNKEKDMFDEANALKLRAGDFDHIVDDISDDEGDEEAGDRARLEMDRKQDIQETKKIIDAVVLGQDKFREMRSLGGMFDQKTLVGEDDKRIAGDNGEDVNDDDIEDFDDDAYYAKQLEIRLAQEAKEREEEERIRKLKEEEELEEMESKYIRYLN